MQFQFLKWRPIVVFFGMIVASGHITHAQTFVNGSMTGPSGIGNTPPGWVNGPEAWFANSPDTLTPGLNYADSGYQFGTMPTIASPDGGTFVALLHSPGVGREGESLGQTLTGFQVGGEYSVTVYAALGDLDGSYFNYDGPTTLVLDIYKKNTTSSTAAGEWLTSYTIAELPALQYNEWGTYQVNFNAPETDLFLAFRNAGDGTNRSTLFVDGTKISAIPEPSGLMLFALSGLLTLRRRRS